MRLEDACMSGAWYLGYQYSHSHSFRNARALCDSAHTHCYQEMDRFGASKQNIIVSFENARVGCETSCLP